MRSFFSENSKLPSLNYRTIVVLLHFSSSFEYFIDCSVWRLVLFSNSFSHDDISVNHIDADHLNSSSRVSKSDSGSSSKCYFLCFNSAWLFAFDKLSCESIFLHIFDLFSRLKKLEFFYLYLNSLQKRPPIKTAATIAAQQAVTLCSPSEIGISRLRCAQIPQIKTFIKVSRFLYYCSVS